MISNKGSEKNVDLQQCLMGEHLRLEQSQGPEQLRETKFSSGRASFVTSSLVKGKSKTCCMFHDFFSFQIHHSYRHLLTYSFSYLLTVCLSNTFCRHQE